MKKILFIIICLFMLTACGKNINSENIDDVQIKKDKIANLLLLNYQYALYAEGSFTLDEGSVLFNSERYYLMHIENPLSLEAILNLPDNIFTEETRRYFRTKLREKMEYISVGDEMYAKRITNGCEVVKNKDFTDFTIKKENNDYFLVSYDKQSFYIYKSDDNLYLNHNVFSCS